MGTSPPADEDGPMGLRRPLFTATAAVASLGLVAVAPAGADAPDRCAGADPFTPALKADVARRFPGHHMTATAYDTRSGCTWRLNPGTQVTTASVIKVEVGTGVLLRAQRERRGLTPGEQARLTPMITESANGPTTELWTSLGGAPAMAQLDRTFGLRDTRQASPVWGLTSTTADDQVHLLRQVVLGEGGGVFSFGAAPFQGSMGGRPLASSVMGMTPSADGYLLVAADGGVFAFAAPFPGSAVGRIGAPAAAIAPRAGGSSAGGSSGGGSFTVLTQDGATLDL